VVVSPRTYFVFTPLLASTAVGTLEFRTTLESVRARRSGVDFIHGWGAGVDFNEKTLRIEEPAIREIPTSATPGDVVRKHGDEASSFLMKYDKLVIAVGCYSQTFNTPGVRENALFLKDVVDAVKIRKRILECETGHPPHWHMLTMKASNMLLYQPLLML
jgi:NADH dehydrogenase